VPLSAITHGDAVAWAAEVRKQVSAAHTRHAHWSCRSRSSSPCETAGLGRNLADRRHQATRSTSGTPLPWCLGRRTPTSGQYARIASRRGKKRAAIAVAHSMLVSAYYVLQRDEPYREVGNDLVRPAPRRRACPPSDPAAATPRPHRGPRPRLARLTATETTGSTPTGLCPVLPPATERTFTGLCAVLAVILGVSGRRGWDVLLEIMVGGGRWASVGCVWQMVV
jgi:hypothetical protein